MSILPYSNKFVNERIYEIKLRILCKQDKTDKYETFK